MWMNVIQLYYWASDSDYFGGKKRRSSSSMENLRSAICGLQGQWLFWHQRHLLLKRTYLTSVHYLREIKGYMAHLFCIKNQTGFYWNDNHLRHTLVCWGSQSVMESLSSLCFWVCLQSKPMCTCTTFQLSCMLKTEENRLKRTKKK